MISLEASGSWFTHQHLINIHKFIAMFILYLTYCVLFLSTLNSSINYFRPVSDILDTIMTLKCLHDLYTLKHKHIYLDISAVVCEIHQKMFS